MTHPFAETLAQKIRIPECVSICAETKELYGYTHFTFDAEKARAVFVREYAAAARVLHRADAPSWYEIENALDIIAERVENVISKK